MEHTCEQHENDAKADERSPREPDGYGGAAEQAEIEPCAIEVMAELGIDISKQRAKSLSKFDDADFDYVVTMCADAAENCPIFPGGASYIHHAFDDTEAVAESGAEHCASFRCVRDLIEDWIETTFL